MMDETPEEMDARLRAKLAAARAKLKRIAELGDLVASAGDIPRAELEARLKEEGF